MIPKERLVVVEGYDPGTSNRACRLPTSSRARRRRKRSEHCRHNEGIVGTCSAKTPG